MPSALLGDGEITIPTRRGAIENSWCSARTFYFSIPNKDVTAVTSRFQHICEMTNA
jgi:hypothetical protein